MCMLGIYIGGRSGLCNPLSRIYRHRMVRPDDSESHTMSIPVMFFGPRFVSYHGILELMDQMRCLSEYGMRSESLYAHIAPSKRKGQVSYSLTTCEYFFFPILPFILQDSLQNTSGTASCALPADCIHASHASIFE